MGFCPISDRGSCGYHSRCAANSTTSCSTTMVTTVSPAINSTSHPFHTGFSTGGGTGGTGAAIAAAEGSGELKVGVSALTGGGSNCGLSEDDKNVLFSLPASTVCFAKTSLLTQALSS